MSQPVIIPRQSHRYMAWPKGKRAPRVRFETYELAETAAIDMAGDKPGSRVLILQEIARVMVTRPNSNEAPGLVQGDSGGVLSPALDARGGAVTPAGVNGVQAPGGVLSSARHNAPNSANPAPKYGGGNG